MRSIVHVCCFLFVFQSSVASTWYASPTGSGDGSIGSPWGLSTALSSASVQPGDTVYLRGGTYSGYFVCSIDGSLGSQIIIRSYPDEWAVIDRNSETGANTLSVTGSYCTLRDFEIKNSNTDRTTDVGRPTGVDVTGPGTILIGLVIHDCGSAIGIWEEATGSTEIAECFIYNNGWFSTASPDGTGHGIYTQNDTGQRLFARNIIVNQFGYGIHAYGSSGELKNMTFRHNVFANNGCYSPGTPGSRADNIMVGGYTDATNIIVHTNYTYTPTSGNINTRFGLYSEANANLSVVGNVFIGGGAHKIEYWTNVIFTGNTVLSPGGDLTITENDGSETYTWNSNTYYLGGAWIYNTVAKTFNEWKADSGYDASSTQTSPAGLSGTWSYLIPNIYSQTGYVVVWNWSDVDNVSVDVSGLIPSGRRYSVKHGQNVLGGVIQTGTFAGGSISLPMTNLVAAVPAGIITATDTLPRWNVFEIDWSSSLSGVSNLRVQSLKGR